MNDIVLGKAYLWKQGPVLRKVRAHRRSGRSLVLIITADGATRWVSPRELRHLIPPGEGRSQVVRHLQAARDHMQEAHHLLTAPASPDAHSRHARTVAWAIRNLELAITKVSRDELQEAVGRPPGGRQLTM